ncbi:MAG: biotin--[Muribaculaceae bacterium]|nr:biotin--[acetyl-CoA-carboxylase] ligase [Muribaculaceae bacterium]
MPTPQYIRLEEINSSNSYLSTIAINSDCGMVVYTNRQTAGRGQRGNTWEAEPGKNLTFSILLKPLQIDAKSQFFVSEIVSIAIVRVLRRYITTHEVAIKWPNDIYVGDKKICGILIENSLVGTKINHSIVGIGININQRNFISDAPNPISLINVINQESDLDKMLREFCDEILSTFAHYDSIDSSIRETLHNQYRSMLWRKVGYHPYSTPDGNHFNARIGDIDPTGILTLIDRDNNPRSFAFKEVTAIV